MWAEDGSSIVNLSDRAKWCAAEPWLLPGMPTVRPAFAELFVIRGGSSDSMLPKSGSSIRRRNRLPWFPWSTSAKTYTLKRMDQGYFENLQSKVELNEMDALNESDGKRLRILFVCTGNTCRSVFAEYIARHKFGNVVESASAGIRPQTAADAASAIATLNDLGIDATRHQPRGLEDVDPAEFDRVVAMEPFVARKFKERFPGFPLENLSKWNINDPWDNPAAYKGCAQEVYAKLKALLQTT